MILLTALGLLIAIEGALYAIAPSTMKRVISQALLLSDEQLRYGGVIALAIGVVVVWLARG